MERKRLVTSLFFVLVHAVFFGTAEECVLTRPCVCETKSGTVVDLNSLPSSIFNAVAPTGFKFYFSPCKPLKQPNCNAAFPGVDLAVCQEVPQSGGPSQYYNAGETKTLTFSGSLPTLSITYTASSGGRKSIVALNCSSEVPSLTAGDESPVLTYNFVLKQSATCPKSVEESSGLSTGSILVIIFFVLFIVYWVGGFLFMKFVRRAEGLEVIPNYEFWKEIPLLIRDGVTFTLRGCKGESTYEKI
ncbi:uncharacterized protein LOC143274741 [Babylonia areolata]|uniref:uncharacterized protein LOC143274741 n=1 Tax=Babylonia areolata TaxID=304850 RepID=UPI003FD2997A